MPRLPAPAPAKKRPGKPPYAAWLRRQFHILHHLLDLRRAEPDLPLARHIEATAERYGCSTRVVEKALREHRQLGVDLDFGIAANFDLSTARSTK